MRHPARLFCCLILAALALGLTACASDDNPALARNPDLEAVWGSNEARATANPAPDTAHRVR